MHILLRGEVKMKKRLEQIALGIILGIIHVFSFIALGEMLVYHNMWELYISFILPLIIAIIFAFITEKEGKERLKSGAILFFSMRITEKITAFICFFVLMANFD